MSDDGYTRITLRIPDGLHAKLTAEAARTSKSMNAEIVARLNESLDMPKPTESALEMRMRLGSYREMLSSAASMSGHQLAALREIQADGHTEGMTDTWPIKEGEDVDTKLEELSHAQHFFHQQFDRVSRLLLDIALAEIKGKPIPADGIRELLKQHGIPSTAIDYAR
ncbi:Arc family DNA-binding protein [Pseudoxanthomonas sp. X-1]|uniref:Arc family DNA-binding protein n=1 Tax=Pseudoxanthomonas sp. X-1 TaxID=2571115 RepID=UPI00110ADFFA|nr:Arc family DNA-binding protein [Pseudoxanthomonas sp. X-1]TMN24523.1 Arc family DNA-binding protein [Pseudoxanthomonas sp. X-1]UAY75210.1 type II toxin-antitoxin system HicB family antitoxin [Pseudoxanthomonas sp. X-1]